MDATEPGGHGVAAEPDRVWTGMVLRFGIALAVFSAAAMLLMALLFKFLEGGAERSDASEAAEAGLARRVDRLPPPPRLEVDGARHWREFRSAEEARLETYGWMDRAGGSVHIPIDRAMEIVLERGVAPLPAAPAPAPAEAKP